MTINSAVCDLYQFHLTRGLVADMRIFIDHFDVNTQKPAGKIGLSSFFA
jgi:hypothetical protein